MDTMNIVLIVLAVIFGVAWYMRRTSRKRRESQQRRKF